MTLGGLVLLLLVLGVGLWALNRFAGAYIDSKILWLINIVVVVAGILFVLEAFGIIDTVSSVSKTRVPQVR